MITLIVPTRNRLYTLKIVAESFYRLRLVSEIIFVSDGGTDESPAFLTSLGARYPDKKTVILVNENRMGAAGSRMRGVNAASNDYILFCDDDQFMEPRYDEVCYQKMIDTGAGAVAGRHIFRLPGEPPADAVRRFGNGVTARAPFNFYTCEFADDAYFEGDMFMPLTNSCLLTTKELLERFGFDDFYSRGNGYREESDYQMKLYVHGYNILVTNAVHTVHLHRTETRTGGQRVNRLKRLYWAVFYTRYFYSKFWDRYARRVGVNLPVSAAVAIFAVVEFYKQFIRPFRHFIPIRLRYVPAAPEIRAADEANPRASAIWDPRGPA
jgi:GT2 family glycosyltransferase